MTPVSDCAYVAVVLGFYADLPHTPVRPSPQDQALARRFQSQGLPLELIESALLLGSLRRMIRPTGSVPLAPIRSLAYFQPVIAELQLQPLPDGYLDFLRLKFRKVSDRIAG
jgi:hypothetical protein